MSPYPSPSLNTASDLARLYATFVGARCKDRDIVGYDQVNDLTWLNQTERIRVGGASRASSSVTASLGCRIAADSKRTLLWNIRVFAGKIRDDVASWSPCVPIQKALAMHFRRPRTWNPATFSTSK